MPGPPTDPTDPGPHADTTDDATADAIGITQSNVVPIDARARGARVDGGAGGGGGRTKPVALPERTGVQSMLGSSLLDNLRESCLTDATIDAARLFTLPSSKWRAYGFTGGGGTAARPQSGLVLPFFAPGATEPHAYRLRPTYALPTRKKGKVKKYDQAFGESASYVYTPPLAATLEHLRDLTTPLYWTEGEKKSLLLAQLGLCVVGLTGVDMFHDLEAKANKDGLKLHPYILQHYAIAGRAHVIVYDADARSHNKPGIMLAAQKLAGVLRALGAASVHLCLPPEGGGAKGIDDYAHAHGIDACAQLLASVRDPVEDIDPDLGCVPLRMFGKWYAGSGAEHLRMPRGYECERDGSLWHTRDLSRPDERELVTDAPMVVTRYLEDSLTSEARTEVRFRDTYSRWQTVVVPRVELGDRRIIDALRPYGASVNASNAMRVTAYLDAFARDNGALIERIACVGTAGWHGFPRQYVGGRTYTRPDTAEPVQLDVSSRDLLRLQSALRPARGADVAAHVEALRVPMDESPQCALAVYAALAAPMLHLFGQPNFALHLCGDSSRGKTSMLRIAASVFGNPRDPAWVASWSMTSAALERRAAMLCDLPQFYDELGAGNVDLIQQNVYTLINGEGRGRATRDMSMRDTASWRTVVLSTGEPELTTEDDATGTQARVINLSVRDFGALGAAEIDAAVEACARHHGALGDAWLDWLVGLEDEHLDRLRTAFAATTAILRARAKANDDPLGQRMSGYFAILALAEDMLAQAWGLGAVGGATVDAVCLARAESGEGRVRPLAERVVSALRDWVDSAPAAFPPMHKVPDNAVAVRGYRHLGAGYEGYVAFIPGMVSEYLSARGLQLTRAVRSELVDAGIMLPETGSGRTALRLSVGKKQRRLLMFKLEVPGQTAFGLD